MTTMTEGAEAINVDAPLIDLFAEILAGLPEGVEPYGDDFGVKAVQCGGKAVLAAYFVHGGRRYRVTLDPIVRMR